MADLLGAPHAPVDTSLFPHSWLSFKIRLDFREHEMFRNFAALDIIRFSGVMGNPRVDTEKAAGLFDGLFSRLYGLVPYLDATEAGSGGAEKERKRFMEEYAKMREHEKK